MTATGQTYGPTEITIDPGAVTRCAGHVDDASRESTRASQEMHSTHLGRDSFGLLNAPLGSAVVALSDRADALGTELARVTARLSQQTPQLLKKWEEVETEATDIAQRLAAAIEKADA